MKAFDRNAFLSAIDAKDWDAAKEYDLRWAHLDGAYLEGAHLRGAYLEDAHLRGAYLEGAHLDSTAFLMVSPIGSRNGVTYFYGGHGDGSITVMCGCYRVDGALPTLAQFAARVDKVYPESNESYGHGAAYRAAIALARVKLGKKEEKKDE
ncbi:MAG: pentapeptide repeat-containing protein [Christensenellaceae bacterium]|jgi:uncharacterized protein YjbI with pentapeptide repeats|nr:pentapeptide repeat-containing protein [Christensenellaceae bacterium]